MDLIQMSAKQITLTERFDKTRLAVLTYAAATVVLATATTVTSAGALGLTGVVIDRMTVMAMTWLASSVYSALLFFVDRPAILALNGDFLGDETWESIGRRLEQIVLEVRAASSQLEPPIHNAANISIDFEKFTNAIFDVDPNFPVQHFLNIESAIMARGLLENAAVGDLATVPGLVRSAISGERKFHHDVEIKIDQISNELNAKIQKVSGLLNDNISAFNKAVGATDKVVSLLRSDLKRLHRGLSRLEKGRLHYWDIAAPLVLWGVGTIMALFVLAGYHIPTVSEMHDNAVAHAAAARIKS